MRDDKKERMEFEAAKAALAGQLDSTYYRIKSDDQRLTLSVAQVKGGFTVPGLTFDAFHLGQAVAIRDALNRAVDFGRDYESRVRSGE